MSWAKKRRSTFRSWSFASYYLFCNNLICLRNEYDFLSKKHRWNMTKKTRTRNVLIRKKMTMSCRTIIARMTISIHRLNEISRTIYCVKRTNDTFFQSFSKENFWSKIMMTRTLIISSTKKLSTYWKKNISETTWTKTLRSMSTFIRHVIESNSWNTNRTTCCNRFLFSKNRNKIERWISSLICHSRNIKKSCTTRCWWWSIVISNSICTFHQRKREMLKIWRTH
jgi:hypothetical protein